MKIVPKMAHYCDTLPENVPLYILKQKSPRASLLTGYIKLKLNLLLMLLVFSKIKIATSVSSWAAADDALRSGH